MTHNENPVLLFDLGGVLVQNTLFSQLKRLLRTERTEAELIEAWLADPIAREYELGRCSTEAFCGRIVEALGLTLGALEFLAVFKAGPQGFYPGAEKLLADLRQRHCVCCLSNSNEAHWTDAVTAPFDHAFSSHLIGRIKPDAEAFQYVVEAVGVEPGHVHFFDDAGVNVQAARDFGLNAHCTPGFEALQRRLSELRFLTARN